MEKQYKKDDIINFVYNNELREGTIVEVLIGGYKIDNRWGVFYVSKEDVISGYRKATNEVE